MVRQDAHRVAGPGLDLHGPAGATRDAPVQLSPPAAAAVYLGRACCTGYEQEGTITSCALLHAGRHWDANLLGQGEI